MAPVASKGSVDAWDHVGAQGHADLSDLAATGTVVVSGT